MLDCSMLWNAFVACVVFVALALMRRSYHVLETPNHAGRTGSIQTRLMHVSTRVAEMAISHNMPADRFEVIFATQACDSVLLPSRTA